MGTGELSGKPDEMLGVTCSDGLASPPVREQATENLKVKAVQSVQVS